MARAMRPLLALLLAALTLLAPAWAAKPAGGGEAQEPSDFIAPHQPVEATGERILSYFSDITVQADGALEVTETIRLRAEGRDIRHGPYRDFPTRYERDGRTVRVGFDLQSVQRDGQAEPYHTESVDNGIRIFIGDPDANVPVGEHTYILRYRTTRQLGFFVDYDELTWNVTGNGWQFPIDRAEARIRLPQAVQLGQRAVYTGAQGATDRNAEVSAESPGDISFRTTAPLAPYEGLTVSVAFPKGVVAAPPPPSASRQWLAANGPMAGALAALAGLAWFFYYAWKRAGRGPIPGTVVPLFEPPDGMSAGAIRYVKRMGFDNRVFAAAIVESGVRGKLRLVEEEGGWLSGDKTRIDKTGAPDDMPTAERNMLTNLFAGGDTISMEKSNHTRFRAAQGALQGAFDSQYKGKFFLANLGWAFAGLMLLLVAMLFVGAVVLAVDPYGEPGTAFVPWFVAGVLLLAIWMGSRSRMVAKDRSWLMAIGAVVLGLAGGLLLIGTFARAGEADGGAWMYAPLLALPLVISAFWWMAAPTREGRAAMDKIAGFERYLSITEEERLETLHPPEKTPELFERYLPHAIALGVENSWAARFASVLAAASALPGEQNRHMGWYSGSQSPWTNAGGFAAAVGGTLASSVASASTAPGSSSSSGGGGFSGGGGGGGGGGGW